MKHKFAELILNEHLACVDKDGYYHYLYKITNLINGHFYYGVHNTKNLNDNYKGSGTRLHKAYKKYGIENFKKEILYYFDNEYDMLNKEFELVNDDLIIDNTCYNLAYGGGRTTYNSAVVKDNDGNILKVLLNDPRYLSGELVGVMKNTITVKDDHGNDLRISKEMFDLNKDKFKPTTTGKVIVYDNDMNSFMVDSNDPRYLSGELQFVLKVINKDTTLVKDVNGKLYRVNKNDKRFKSGDLVGVTKNQIRIKKDGKIKSINPEDLDKYLADDWALGCYQKGQIVVTKNNKNKFINPEDLDKYLADGWKHESQLKHTYTIVKNNKLKRINPEDLDKYLADGWKRTNKMKGKININNGINNKRINPEDLDKYLADGWKIGSTQKSCLGKVAINKNGDRRFVSLEELNTYLSNGWEKGLNHKK